MITASVGEYRTAMREFASMRNLDVWYSRLQIREGLPQLHALLSKKGLKEAERLVEKARTKDSLQAFDKLTHVVDGEPRIVSDPPLIVPIEELLTAEQAATFLERYPRAPSHLPSEPPRGSPIPPGGLPLRPCGAQGGRRGQRRHPGVDRPHARSRQRRSAVPPGQGGSGFGARSLRRQEPIRQSGSAGGRGPAADAGRERHLPRMGTGRRPVRWQARFLHPAAPRLEGLVANRRPWTRA